MLLYVDAQFTSPYAMSVFVALKHKGMPFELRTVDLDAGANHTPAYARASLTQRVPLLVDGDFQLSESTAITEYLEDLYAGAPLYPADLKDKARARQVQAWLRSDLLALRTERSTQVIFYAPVPAPLSGAARAAADKLLLAAATLLAPGSDYLFGEWSLADVDLALMLNRLAANGDAVPERLAAYVRRQWAHPAVQAWAAFARPPL